MFSWGSSIQAQTKSVPSGSKSAPQVKQETRGSKKSQDKFGQRIKSLVAPLPVPVVYREPNPLWRADIAKAREDKIAFAKKYIQEYEQLYIKSRGILPESSPFRLSPNYFVRLYGGTTNLALLDPERTEELISYLDSRAVKYETYGGLFTTKWASSKVAELDKKLSDLQSEIKAMDEAEKSKAVSGFGKIQAQHESELLQAQQTLETLEKRNMALAAAVGLLLLGLMYLYVIQRS